MSLKRLTQLLHQPESIRLEFKEAATDLPRNLFESVCAMLNRDGGDIVLGANDRGEVTGVSESHSGTMITNLVNLSNNPQKLDPPFILFPQLYELDGQRVIHVQVPASSQVHKTNGIIYDRSHDGDFKVTQPHQIAGIFNRKRTHYSEGLIYPALRFEDFKADLFPKVRNLIRSNAFNHPWLTLDDHQLLVKAGLWRRDWQAGQEGYTLAAALLFGTDEVIQSILPHYKIDALVRIQNTDRYDDRAYIQTNLIEAYEQLMDFVAKHLPDPFYMEGDQRVSLRTKIFREVVANLLVHREYTNAHPCTFVIYKDRVLAENANNPHGEGLIDPHQFAPFPKNPSLVKFFIQLGRADELGSGVLKVSQLGAIYSGGFVPQFIEGPVFRMVIPTPVSHAAPDGGLNEGLNEGLKTVLALIQQQPGIQAKDIAEQLNRPIKTVERQLKALSDQHYIQRIGSRKTGGYHTIPN
jgi:ATP-dependent DNA helicase RecG